MCRNVRQIVPEVPLVGVEEIHVASIRFGHDLCGELRDVVIIPDSGPLTVPYLIQLPIAKLQKILFLSDSRNRDLSGSNTRVDPG